MFEGGAAGGQDLRGRDRRKEGETWGLGAPVFRPAFRVRGSSDRRSGIFPGRGWSRLPGTIRPVADRRSRGVPSSKSIIDSAETADGTVVRGMTEGSA